MASYHTPFAYKYLFPDVTPLMSAVVFLAMGIIASGLIIAKKKNSKEALTFGLFLLLTSIFAIQTPILID